MAAKPQYVQDLIAEVKSHTEHLANLRQENADLWESIDALKDLLAETRSDNTVIKQQVADLIKKTEEWDRRWWSLMAVFVAALLSLAAGLIVTIVTLAKK